MLTQTFPIVLAAALVWVGCALVSRRTAVLGGLLIGLGVASLWLTGGAGWQGQTWVWVVLSVALLVAGGAATRVAQRDRDEAVARRPAYRRSKAIVVATVVASLVVAGFGLPARPGEYALPTGSMPAWIGVTCAGVGLVNTEVRGTPNDPHVAWLEQSVAVPGQAVTTQRLEATWPEGYRARFTPRLEILDGWGNVVFRDGDAVGGACGEFNGGFDLAPPFN
jgi:hypothetical protein